jgi:hypothetical protein
MKLNLCCGEDIREGCINIDIRKTRPNVLILDLEKELLQAFPDNSVEEIGNDGGTNIACWIRKKC